MLKQKQSHNNPNNQFQILAVDSPQIKPSSNELQIQDINIEDDQNHNQQKSNKKPRRKKIKQKQTNLIKIKPVINEEDIDVIKIQKTIQNPYQNHQQIQSRQQILKIQQKSQIIINKHNQAFQSPVLYRISDQQDLQHKQQQIPQSSRRPLKQKQKSPQSQKRSDSDSLDSPVKLMKSPRKPRTKIQKQTDQGRKFIKMKQQIQILQQKQSNQIYNYNQEKEQQFKDQYLDEGQSSEQNNDDSQQDQNKSQQQRETADKTSESKPQITVFKSNSFFTLINAQIPKGNFVNCIIKRKRGQDLFQKIVTYQLYLLEDKKYLMTCVKDRLFKTTSHFQFYRQKTNSLKYHKDNLYAYLDSNFTGTQFVLKSIHKNDTNSQKSTAIDKSQLIKMEDSMSVISDQVQKTTNIFNSQSKFQKSTQNLSNQYQKQICFISFKANFFGLAGQRQVKLLKKKNKKLKKTGNFSDLKSAQQNGQIDRYIQFQSKKAILGKNGLQLDFKGIAKVQSTKNIILQNETQKQVLIFGKVKQDIYSVAIGHPLSIIEGLAFGISNLDRKFFVN